MKKILAIISTGIVLLTGLGAGASLLQETSLKQTVIADISNDEYIVYDEEDDVSFLFGLRGPLINRIFNFLDMLSFSIYEDSDTPEFLYMKMDIGEVKFTELRALYNIIWDYKGLLYCTGVHMLNSSETILDYSAYYETDGTEHKIWNTSVDIDEDHGIFTWTITKKDLGLQAGDVLENPYAKSAFMTKDWDAQFPIVFAEDATVHGDDYIIQY